MFPTEKGTALGEIFLADGVDLHEPVQWWDMQYRNQTLTFIFKEGEP